MSNLINPSILAAESLDQLEYDLVAGNLVYRDKTADFSKVGGYAVSTFFIDTSIYIPALTKKLKELGVTFITRTLTSLDTFAREAPKGTVIFKASGLGSRWLVPDENMYPIRGDLCIFESADLSSEKGNDYLLSWGERGDYMFTRVSTSEHPGQFIFGGVYEENDASTDPKEKYCKRTIESYLQFLKISTGKTE